MKHFDPKYTVPTLYWHKLDDGRIQCDLCPRFCKLKDGSRGLCFVRAREEDQIVLTTYGRSSGFCIDPIEKKPLNHFLPGTSVMSFGTAGCNLACKFCQNWDISKSRETDTLADEASPEKIAEVAKKLGCRSVAFTYNDPVIFLEYAIDVAKECRKRDIKTVAVTAGEILGEARELFFSHMDATNVDLKGFTDEFYHKNCSGDLETVLETLKYVKNKTNVWLEITTLLIPDENDAVEEIDRMTKWLLKELGPSVPLHFSAFHPDYKMMDKPHTSENILIRSRNIARANGLQHVYTGNILDGESQSTYCTHCQKILIGRTGYTISEYNLDANGVCKFCHTELPGVFQKDKGTWGSRRVPVMMSVFD